jgi:hypothetical protein
MSVLMKMSLGMIFPRRQIVAQCGHSARQRRGAAVGMSSDDGHTYHSSNNYFPSASLVKSAMGLTSYR